MRTCPIGELTSAVATWNPSRTPNETFEYVDLGAVDNIQKIITGTMATSGADAPSRARQLLAAGDVLVSTVRPNLNAVAVVPPELHGATASTGFTVLRPGPALDTRFLFHWVRSPVFVQDMVRKATGASYPAVSDRIVKESGIPHLPLVEQRRLATILDHADAVRAKRRAVLQHLDSLGARIFEDMFSESRAPMQPLAAVADVSSGITKGRRKGDATRPTPYLAVANVQAGRLSLGQVKEIDATEAEIERYTLRNGDLVLTEGGDPDKLGRGTVWRGELPLCLHQNHIFRVRVRKGSEVLPEYLSAYMASRAARSYFRRSAKQTTGIASINMSQLKALPVLLPATEAQMSFVERMEHVTRQQSTVVTSTSLDDDLFASLQARAYRGEL